MGVDIKQLIAAREGGQPFPIVATARDFALRRAVRAEGSDAFAWSIAPLLAGPEEFPMEVF
jgi:hypothetical protein